MAPLAASSWAVPLGSGRIATLCDSFCFKGIMEEKKCGLPHLPRRDRPSAL
jgi:hypothetical protein